MNDKDIEIIEGLLIHSESTLLDEEALAIEKLLKENEELKTMLKNRIKYTNELEQDLFENASNYVVSKAKIESKIDFLQAQLTHIACGNDDCEKCFTQYRGSTFVYCFAYHQIKILKELLEGK